MTLAPATKLGPYEILAAIGAGGMGEVYKAKDTRLDRFVAIKVLPEDFAKNPDSLARFEREAKAVAALNHPNIMGVHDFATHDDTPYVVMELLEGESLRTRLLQGALTPRKAIELGTQMAQGLAAAHDKGVIHRDLKPDNLWITTEGRLKILDFGLAKQMTALGRGSQSYLATEAVSPGHVLHTEEGVILGTMGYMSPEQVRGETVDARSDIFSFGAVLFEMLTGRKAFSRPTSADTMAAILKEDPPELDDTSRPIPPALHRILDHCLEKIPSRRFHDAQDLAFALENALGSSSSSGVGPAPASLPAAMRRPWPAAVVLLLVGAVAAWFMKPPPLRHFPTFTQITFRRGNVLRARFTSDGQSVVYSAAWDGKPSELFLARADGTGTRPLGYPKADLQAVNAKGELLLIIKPDLWTGTTQGWGTLALSSLEGGTPRELKEQVFSADFGPDGQSLALSYQTPEGAVRVEYPQGNRLLESSTLGVGSVRVSPKGDQVAVMIFEVGETAVAVLDRSGKRRDLYRTKNTLDESLVWSRDGRSLFISEFTRGNLLELNLDGHVRQIHSDTSSAIIDDQSSQGRLLIERELDASLTMIRREGKDVDLSLGDTTRLVDLSQDGAWALLGDDPGVGGNPHAYLRRADGSPPKPLGLGVPMSLSPDAKWALIGTFQKTGKLRLVPTGAGAERELALAGWDLLYGRFSGDGTRVFAVAVRGDGPPTLAEFPLSDPKGRILDIPVQNLIDFTPDGKQLLRRDDKGRVILVPIAGGSSRTMGWTLEAEEFNAGWTLQGELLIAHAIDPAHVRVDKINLDTGARTPLQMLTPPDPVGIVGSAFLVMSRDGKTLGYSFSRVVESNLLVADGIEAK